MTLRTFTFGMIASFGSAWLFAVVIPFYKTRDVKPVEYAEGIDEKEGLYFPKRTGQITNGAKVYAQNGCYVCHTQVIRPTYAGNDIHRDGWAGFKADPDRGDTRRETNRFDFIGEEFAQIGVMRIGPDLSNVGSRFEKAAVAANTAAKEAAGDAWDAKTATTPEALLYDHLFDPRAHPSMRWSTCPSMHFLFDKSKQEGALPTPTPEAHALVSYLLSMKKNDTVPASMNYAPPKPAAK